MIPSRAHLIWLGPQLPALGYIAVRSALENGGFGEVVLHHDTPDPDLDPLLRDLATRPGFSMRSVDIHAMAATDAVRHHALGPAAWSRLAELDSTLGRSAGRSNLLRLAILWLEGGVYIDTDVVVHRPFESLLAGRGFAGLERICFPLQTVQSVNPLRWARAGLLTTLRAGVARFARDPGRAFHSIRGLYSLAANNAVLGAMPAHPLVRALLLRAASLSTSEATRRFRLGPRLLQEATGNRSTREFELLAPATFYPLPPEICRAFVRDDPGGQLQSAPADSVVASHLYDSNLRRHLGAAVDADYLRRTRGRTLLSRMVEPYLDDLFGAAGPEFAVKPAGFSRT